MSWESPCGCLDPTSRFLSQNLWGGVGWGEDLRVFVKISTEAPWWCRNSQRFTITARGAWDGWLRRVPSSPYFSFRPGLTLGRLFGRTESFPEWTSTYSPKVFCSVKCWVSALVTVLFLYLPVLLSIEHAQNIPRAIVPPACCGPSSKRCVNRGR